MAQMMKAVLGHTSVKLRIEQAILTNKLPHALVFAGPHGVGKFKTAYALAQALTCENKSLGFACGQCGGCLRAEKKQSENIKVIEADGLQIKIDQIRQVLDFLSLSNFGRSRVIIIDQAQNLNPQASNALLKTLEEPQNNVYFILVTPDVRLLMPTIRSRSQVISFKTLNDEELRKIHPEASSWVLKSARGQVQKVFELSEADSLDSRNLDFDFFEFFWTDKNFLQKFEVKEVVTDRKRAQYLLKNWAVFCRDLILLQLDEKDQVINSDLVVRFKAMGHLTLETLFQFSHQLIQSEKDVEKLDLGLVFEALWIKFARGYYV